MNRYHVRFWGFSTTVVAENEDEARLKALVIFKEESDGPLFGLPYEFAVFRLDEPRATERGREG